MTTETQPIHGPDVAVVMIKPDGLVRNVGEYPFRDLLLGLIDSVNLDITESTTTKLEEEDIRSIYPNLNEISDYGTQWQLDVIEHLQTSPVEAYVVRGNCVNYKLGIVKQFLRSRLTDSSSVWGKVIANLVHVSDPEEYTETYQTLFKESL